MWEVFLTGFFWKISQLRWSDYPEIPLVKLIMCKNDENLLKYYDNNYFAP